MTGHPGSRRTRWPGRWAMLPLALAQAAAYIRNEDITIGRYLDLLATRLLREVVPEPGHLTDDHQRIITATWELSIDQASRARPAGLARPLLQLASVLDPAGIPQQALSSPPALAYLASAPAATAADPDVEAVDEAMVDEALRVLHRYSLIDHDRASRYREVRVHQLVQRATRENLHPARPRPRPAHCPGPRCRQRAGGSVAGGGARRARPGAARQRHRPAAGRRPGPVEPRRGLRRTVPVRHQPRENRAGHRRPRCLHHPVPGRAAPPRPRPPRHPDRPRQPGAVAGRGGGRGGRGHRVRGAAGRLAAGARPRPPRHPDHPQQPGALAGRGGGRGGRGHRIRGTAGRPAAGARPRPPRHPDHPQQPGCGGGARRGTRRARPPHTRSCWPTTCGCSAPTTPTP